MRGTVARIARAGDAGGYEDWAGDASASTRCRPAVQSRRALLSPSSDEEQFKWYGGFR